MWGNQNSIEPVRAVATAATSTDDRFALRVVMDKMSVREARTDELTAAARRTRTSAGPESAPIQAVQEPRGSLFRRRPAEPDRPDVVAQQHGLYTAEKGYTRRYYADYQQRQEVMRASHKRIVTKLDDKQTVSAMLDLAQSRGWDTVRVKGTADFQREAWVQAQVRGMKAEGYRPSATDQQEATRRKAAATPIQAPPVQAPAAKAAESTAPAGAAASKDTAKAVNSVTVSAPAEKAEAVAASQPRRATTARRTAAAAPAPGVSDAATSAKPDKAKMVSIQRSKAVWGAVEATGQQARAADPAVAKVTAGERPTAATVS